MGQVNTFGLGLVSLDVRQESTKHSLALNTITEYLGIGSYKYESSCGAHVVSTTKSYMGTAYTHGYCMAGQWWGLS